MPGTFFGPYSEKYNDYAFENNANLGRFPLGHTLILPDGREYKFTLNDGTVEVAGNLYQGVAPIAAYQESIASVAAIGATALAASTSGSNTTAVDIFSEGAVHVNEEVGEGYSFRIQRAFQAGDSHASAASLSLLTVNLAAGESLQVAITTASQLTFTRNRYHAVTHHLAPPTAQLSGVSPGVAAADRYYWSQVKGYAAVLTEIGVLFAGNRVQAGTTTNGAVEGFKRRVRTAGTSVIFLSATAIWGLGFSDEEGNAVAGVYALSSLISGATAATYDITAGIAYNAPVVGTCVQPNTSTDYALIDLMIS